MLRVRLVNAERALIGHPHAPNSHHMANKHQVKAEDSLSQDSDAAKRRRSEAIAPKSASSSPKMNLSLQNGPAAGPSNGTYPKQYLGPEPSGYQLQSTASFSQSHDHVSPFADPAYPLRPPSSPAHLPSRHIVLPLPIPRQASCSSNGCRPGPMNQTSDKCCGKQSGPATTGSPMSTPGMSPSQAGSPGGEVPPFTASAHMPKHATSLPLPSQAPSFPMSPSFFHTADATSSPGSTFIGQAPGSRSSSLSMHDPPHELPSRPLPKCILESSEKNICCQGLFDCSGLPPAMTSSLHQMSTELVNATAAGRTPPEFLPGAGHAVGGQPSRAPPAATPSQADAELLLALPTRQLVDKRKSGAKPLTKSPETIEALETDKECCWGVMDCAPGAEAT